MDSSAMRKVCVLTSVHPASDVRIFYKECKSLVQAGYDVTLIVPHERDEVIDGVRIKALSKPKGRIARMTHTAWQVYRVAVRLNADVYHFHDPELIPVGLLLKAKGKKVVYDVHEHYKQHILSKYYIPSFLRRLLAESFDLFESFSSRFFDGVIVVDKVTQAKFSGITVLVHNYPYLPGNIGEFKRDESRFTIVYAGNLSKDQGLFKVIKAMEYVEGPARLLLIGKYVREAERKAAEAIKGYEKVDWLGYKLWPEALKIIGASHLGLVLFQPVSTYLYNGENIVKLFEYMMFGLPVVASDFPNLADIIKNESCGVVVNPTDPMAIARAINTLMKAPDLLKQMGENGKKAVAEKYKWELASKNLLQLYGSILDKESRGLYHHVHIRD